MGSVQTIFSGIFDVFGGFIGAGLDAVEGFWEAGTGSLGDK